jgi:hypothetical protein
MPIKYELISKIKEIPINASWKFGDLMHNKTASLSHSPLFDKLRKIPKLQ